MTEYRMDRSGRVWTLEQYVYNNNPNQSISAMGMKAMWENLQTVNIQPYDSTADTLGHIKKVNEFLINSVKELLERAKKHDLSKLEGIEKELFDEMTPILRTLAYGSTEYKASLEKLKPALDHHYANNTHHPEFYERGVDGMDLFDVIEMLNDWKAATLRTADGDLMTSLDINRDRFNISDQLYSILVNTVKNSYWL